MIWLHDIYLLLAPIYLKQKDKDANIGLSIHSPTASSDIFKTFEYRAEILRSMLCCDLIGFHMFEYCRNFITACKKILELDYVKKKGGFLGIEYNGRTVILNINHIGIQQDDIKEKLKT